MKNKSMTGKKILTAVLIMTMALLTLTACGGNDAQNQDEEMTKLVLGTSADYAPFEFMYPDENGDMQFGGIDIYVPYNVNVKVNSNSIFGGVSQKNRRSNDPNAVTVYVNATCMFGGVEIK